MASGVFLREPSLAFSAVQQDRFESLRFLIDITTVFPPESLNSDERITLGIKVLEKYGEAEFSYYQRVYRLTKVESASIFKGAGSYQKDLAVWEPLDESCCREDVELVRGEHPQAKFFLLTMKEENHRTMPVVEIEGKRYYFYSHAFKGPVVDEKYTANYDECRAQERRPDFKVINGKGKTVFLMECVGVQTPNFREEADITLLMDLIVCFSLNKKGLDMLPCRLAVKEGRMYCVDQKPSYGLQTTQWHAFQSNIDMLKGKIKYRGYAEEGQLLDFVDRIAARHEVDLFEKSLDNPLFDHSIHELFPAASLNSDQRINLAAAALRKYGTLDLMFIGKTYCLSVEDKRAAMRSAGDRLRNNIVTWDQNFGRFEEFKQKTEAVLSQQGLQGEFAMYLNKVGNYKEVLTVKIDGQIYVVRETNQAYIDEYQLRKDREHRPDSRAFPIEGGRFIFLSQFMGAQTVDYSDKQHVDLMIDLAMNFSNGDTSIIDRNQGNLIVDAGKLYYIDKDLTYSRHDNPRLENVKNVFVSIDEFFHVEHERAACKRYVKERVLSMLDPLSCQDKEVRNFLIPPPPPVLSSIPDYRQFLAAMDMEKPDDREALIMQLPIFFQTAQDFLNRNLFKLAVLQTISKSPYSETHGWEYYQAIEERVGQLMEAFLAAHK